MRLLSSHVERGGGGEENFGGGGEENGFQF